MTKSEYVYRTLGKGDETAVKQLVRNVFDYYLGGDYWEWKYLRNPDFDPSMVAVTERDGKIIGCNHWLLRDFKLSSSLTTKALLCADIAVHPEHRKHGVGKSLLVFLRSTGIFKSNGAVVNYMFADLELGKRLYQPVVGYIPIPTSTVTYTKRLNWKKIMRKIYEMNEKMKPRRDDDRRTGKRNFKISLHVLGAPPLVIAIGESIEAKEENAQHVNVRVESDLATLIGLVEEKKRLRRLLKELLTGKLRIRGSLLSIWRLYQSFNMLEEIFC